MENSRLQTTLNDIESRVEDLRVNAISIQKEREALLELLQTLQDNTVRNVLDDADRDDLEWQLERLIIRCLTVDVSVATPRNDVQEDAFKKVTDILDRLKGDVKKDCKESEKCVESYLNASLPEPLSGNINHKFQEKLLSCTIDDQKVFRRKLQRMYSELTKSSDTLLNETMKDEQAQSNYSNSAEDTDNEKDQNEKLTKEPTHHEFSHDKDYAADKKECTGNSL